MVQRRKEKTMRKKKIWVMACVCSFALLGSLMQNPAQAKDKEDPPGIEIATEPIAEPATEAENITESANTYTFLDGESAENQNIFCYVYEYSFSELTKLWSGEIAVVYYCIDDNNGVKYCRITEAPENGNDENQLTKDVFGTNSEADYNELVNFKNSTEYNDEKFALVENNGMLRLAYDASKESTAIVTTEWSQEVMAAETTEIQETTEMEATTEVEETTSVVELTSEQTQEEKPETEKEETEKESEKGSTDLSLSKWISLVCLIAFVAIGGGWLVSIWLRNQKRS
jgi:hypothetical protein